MGSRAFIAGAGFGKGQHGDTEGCWVQGREECREAAGMPAGRGGRAVWQGSRAARGGTLVGLIECLRKPRGGSSRGHCNTQTSERRPRERGQIRGPLGHWRAAAG